MRIIRCIMLYGGMAGLALFVFFGSGCKWGKGNKGFLDTDFVSSIRLSSGAVHIEGLVISTPIWNSGDITTEINPDIRITPRFNVHPDVDVKQDFNFYFRKPWPMYEVTTTTTTLMDGKTVPMRVVTRVPVIADSTAVKLLYCASGFVAGVLTAFLIFIAIRFIFAKNFHA